MRRWAVVVVLLYLLILLVFTGPVFIAGFYPAVPAGNVTEILIWPQYWAWVAVMVAGQAVMLLVPVDQTFRRPTSRRSVLWPVLAAGLMMGLLALGAVGSVLEYTRQDQAINFSDTHAGIGFAIVLGVWLAWTLIFYRLHRGLAPMDVVTRQCRLLLKGSVLELLVAVPTHVVARYRDYCCAGFLTFIGIAFGLAVMIFSFGPGVFLLFVERWRHLHPNLGAAPGKPS